MFKFLSQLRQDENGAVTIDWVLLTAAILTLGSIVGASVSAGAENMADNTGTELQSATVPEVVF